MFQYLHHQLGGPLRLRPCQRSLTGYSREELHSVIHQKSDEEEGTWAINLIQFDRSLTDSLYLEFEGQNLGYMIIQEIKAVAVLEKGDTGQHQLNMERPEKMCRLAFQCSGLHCFYHLTGTVKRQKRVRVRHDTCLLYITPKLPGSSGPWWVETWAGAPPA